MPRWLFLTFVVALVLAVFGSAFIALRGSPSPGNTGKPAVGLSCGALVCSERARSA